MKNRGFYFNLMAKISECIGDTYHDNVDMEIKPPSVLSRLRSVFEKFGCPKRHFKVVNLIRNPIDLVWSGFGKSHAFRRQG